MHLCDGAGGGRQEERARLPALRRTPSPTKSHLHVLFPNSCWELLLNTFPVQRRSLSVSPLHSAYDNLRPPSYSHSQRPSLGAQPGWVAAKAFLPHPHVRPSLRVFLEDTPSLASPIANSPRRGNRGTGQPNETAARLASAGASSNTAAWALFGVSWRARLPPPLAILCLLLLHAPRLRVSPA